jgi:hypothetical protein
VPVSEAHDLYGLPLERFVPERTALVRKLRDEGRRDEAAEVANLPKPSVAGWAVNQLVRTQGRAVSELFSAGDALQKAQSDLLAGRSDGETLREATERERAALEALLERGRGLLTAEGHELSQTMLDRVAETLHAAAVDDEVRARVEEGSLTKELRHTGLGGAGEVMTSPATGARTRAARPRGKPPKPSAGPQRARRAADADRDRARRRDEARKAESDSRRAAQIAVKALDKAKERRDRAAVALQDAEDELKAARERARETERTHKQARQELDRIK